MVGESDSLLLQVAIVGSGIAGLTAAIALRQHPKINVVLYEKATELKEIGASIALGPNGLRTLERLGLYNVIDDKVAFRGPSNIPMIYRHWETNEIIGEDVHEMYWSIRIAPLGIIEGIYIKHCSRMFRVISSTLGRS